MIVPIFCPYFHCFHYNEKILQRIIIESFVANRVPRPSDKSVVENWPKFKRFLLFQIAHNYEVSIETAGQVTPSLMSNVARSPTVWIRMYL